MSNLTRHVMLPSLAPLALVALYFTPKDLFGCANRGLMALAVVFMATLASYAAIWRFGVERKRGSDHALWWLITAFLLILPLALLIGPLR